MLNGQNRLSFRLFAPRRIYPTSEERVLRFIKREKWWIIEWAWDVKLESNRWRWPCQIFLFLWILPEPFQWTQNLRVEKNYEVISLSQEFNHDVLTKIQTWNQNNMKTLVCFFNCFSFSWTASHFWGDSFPFPLLRVSFLALHSWHFGHSDKIPEIPKIVEGFQRI